ncbi:unnamed protein product (macronuclear) [Paramecium tetraurelia]|uniref:Major facilitator superfamily (MFS) profile domain-containing protein n=1 Tax=Paramecium tetraurelia TaxID=5888 RepID=A0BQN9_PARTE|nr:uncharacterized protein GSPATT00031085001 [Paramecium tetraurelia]CAK60856.1 unnamed protein product [Paramecium tetraurelia]|eukprot:XP_001428254.1 hypothetical protein (macronuclear) [Paramecium tetraurelia strain d4-2]
MANQVIPLYNQESENSKTDSGYLQISKVQNQSQLPSVSDPLTSLPSQINKKFTVQSDSQVEEGLKSFVHLAIILVAIQSGNFSVGYSLSYLSMSFTTLFSQITLKGSEIEEQGLFSAVLSIGQLVGAVVTKPLLKYTTRNQSLLIADFFGVLSILQVIPNREVILAFRFSYGMCLGISSVIMAIYVKELCPDKYYETFSVLASFLIAGGLFFINFIGLGYLNPDLRGEHSYYWQIVFAIPSLVHFLRSFIITIVYKIDSPDSLIQLKQPSEAKRIIIKLYQPEFVEQIFLTCLKRVENDSEQSEGFLSLFSKKHLKTVIIGCLLAFISTWCGLFALYSYCSQIFDVITDGDFTLNTIFILIIGIVQFIPAFISKFVYRKIGNRTLLLGGLLVLIVCQILIIGLSYSETVGASITSFIIICFFSFTFALTLGPITYSMIPEINTSEGTYFCFVTLYVWQLFMLYIFPFMLDALQISGVFIVFAILTLLSILYFYVYVKETKGLSHTEIEKQYGKL